MRLTGSVVTFLIVCFVTPAAAETRVEKNVVFGMYSGLALVMDVYHPEQPNGYGVIVVNGSGWERPLGYDAPELKDVGATTVWLPSLIRAGYTAFAINHRAAPRFHYPEPVEDVQRAVRFVRHHAARFGIDPARLGAAGHSSGGHLMSLAAMVGAGGIAGDANPVNREPATVQCLFLQSASTDLREPTTAEAVFMNLLPSSADSRALFAAASPITRVSGQAPPTFLIHGDSDDTVPFQKSVAMEAALRDASVPTRLILVQSGEHRSNLGTADKPHPRLPELLTEIVRWFDQHLKGRS